MLSTSKRPGIAIAVPVQQTEGQGVVAALEPLPVQALFQNFLHSGANYLLDFGKLAFLGVPYLPAEPSLLHAVVQGHLHIRAQTGIQHRPLQGGFRIPSQVVRQQSGGVEGDGVVIAAKQLAKGEDGFGGAVLLRADFVGNPRFPVGQGLLHGNGKGKRLPGVLA